MTVEGALCSKARCGWSKPVALLEREAAGRTAEEALSASCMKGATVDRRGDIGIDG